MTLLRRSVETAKHDGVLSTSNFYYQNDVSLHAVLLFDIVPMGKPFISISITLEFLICAAGCAQNRFRVFVRSALSRSCAREE